MPVVHSNPGLAELDALTVMGVSIKEGETPIGRFGTGFKYAIATLLRHHQSVELFLGTERLTFIAAPRTIRGVEFDMVFMKRGDELVPLQFTTKLGRDWELWMAFRELHSNALDEGGESHKVTMHLPAPGDTAIVVTGDLYEGNQGYGARHTVFLETTPSHALEGVDLHPTNNSYPGGGRIYYRGVIAAMGNLAWNANIREEMILTEDRTIKNVDDARHRIGRAIAGSTDPQLISTFLDRLKVEGAGEFQLHTGYSPSEEFLDEAERRYIRGDKLSDYVEATLKHKRRHLGATAEVPLNDMQREVRERAENFVMKLGFDISAYKIYAVSAIINEPIFEGGRYGIGISNFNSVVALAQQLIFVMGKAEGGWNIEPWVVAQVVNLGQRLLNETL